MIVLGKHQVERPTKSRDCRVAKSHGYAGITREEGLQNGQSLRKVSCQHTT